MMSAAVLSGVAQEYLRLRSRSPPPATTPTCPVLLDRLTLSRDRLPTCEPLCCVGHDKYFCIMSDGGYRVALSNSQTWGDADMCNSRCNRDRVATADGVARSRVARWSAYFSVRPPSGPVQLVPVSTPPKLPALSPRSFTSSPPPHSSDLATQQNKMRCRNAVHGVLCELMSTLPLPPSPIKSPTSPTTSATPGTPPTPPTSETPVYTAPPVRAQRIRRLDRDLLPLTLAKGLSTDSTGSTDSVDNGARHRQRRRPRHVATQARRTIKNVPLDECPKATTGERERATDEWLGGVRALRDSHVRLVLRQLRHIERLNRALDRASPRSSRSPRSPRSRPR